MLPQLVRCFSPPRLRTTASVLTPSLITVYMENRFGAPASGTPEGSARREFELLLLLGGSRKAAVQLWLRKQRIYANAQQAAGRPATEAKGSRGAAERQAGGESKPETAAQAARRHRSEHRLREKHLARKIWAAVRVRKHLSRWCERARAAVAKRPASSSTTSTAAAAPPPAPPPPLGVTPPLFLFPPLPPLSLVFFLLSDQLFF